MCKYVFQQKYIKLKIKYDKMGQIFKVKRLKQKKSVTWSLKVKA